MTWSSQWTLLPLCQRSDCRLDCVAPHTTTPVAEAPIEDCYVLQGLSPRLKGINAALLCSTACSEGSGPASTYRLSDRALTQLVSGAAAGCSPRRPRELQHQWGCGGGGSC